MVMICVREIKVNDANCLVDLASRFVTSVQAKSAIKRLLYMNNGYKKSGT